MKTYSLTICFILFSGICTAQKQWTLRECIDYAIEHNIDIKQQEIELKNSETDLRSKQGNRLPSLSAGSSQSFNFGRSQSQETGIFEDVQTSSTSISASASVSLFSGFGLNNTIKAGKLNLKAATEGLKKAKDNLEIQIAQLYLDILFKKEILRVYQHQAELTSGQVERTEILVKSGKVPGSQLFDIKSQFAKDELNITNALNALDFSRLNLSQALNIIGDDFEIVLPEPGYEVSQNITSPDLIYKEVSGLWPHIKEAEYRLESSLRGVKVAQSTLWPSLSLGGSYASGFSNVMKSPGENNSSETPPFTQLKNNQRQAIGLNLNIPVFNRNQSRNQVKMARLAVESSQLRLEGAKQILFKEIQQACQRTVAAKAKQTATEKAVQAATEALTYIEERYEVGKSTVYELSDAQTKLINARSEQLQAKYEFIFYTKILDFYRGKKIVI